MNSYQTQSRSADNKLDTSTYGSTAYNSAANQQTKQASDLDKAKGGYSSVDNSSIYSAIKPAQHHASNKASSLYYHQPKTVGGAAQVPGTRSSIMSLQDTLYHPPFSPSMNANANCLYGYTGQHPAAAAAVAGATPAVYHHPALPQHHHHSIPSLYQPSVIYQQTPTQAQSFYDAAAANSALAILDNSATQHYGTTQAYAGQLAAAAATAEPTYGQYYYPTPVAQPLGAGREASANALNFHPGYYQSQSLYDYIPFPRAITPGTVNPMPAAAHGQKPHSSQHGKSRSSLAGVIDQRLYSSSLEVPMTPKESIYYESKHNNKAGCGQSKSGSSGQHHHHYYYHQVYGTTGGKYGQQHYGTVRHSPMTSSLNHNHHLLAPNSTPLVAAGAAATDVSGTSAATQSNQSRHLQHYFPEASHSSSSSTGHTSSSSSRQHHSSHPQLLAGACLTLPGAHHSTGSTAAANVESGATTSGTMSYRRGHQHHNHHHPSSSHVNNSIYGPIGLGSGSVGHYGYSLEHAANAAHSGASMFGHSRNDAFANPNFTPLGSSNLHHSNSFHGHLDDFDLVGLGSAGGTGAASDFETTSETQQPTAGSSSGSKSGHSKGHGHSGWV